MARSAVPTRIDLQQLADSRLNEAKVLAQHHLYDGAVYLAGYALELAFKARICKVLDADYPTEGAYSSFKTHSYSTLLRLAGLEKALDQVKLRDATFNSNWSILIGTSGASGTEGWSETWRYRSLGSVTAVDANRFLSALEDANSGVLTWLKTLW
jgi:hypothetical protein